MHKIRIILGIAVGLLIIASCGGSATTSSMAIPKQPQVARETLSYTAHFDEGKLRLSQEEFRSFSAFVQSVPSAAVTHVGIGVNPSDSTVLARAGKIRAYLIQAGIDPKAIHAQPSASNDNQDIMLMLEYAKAMPPTPCPDWSQSTIANYGNHSFSNFGCAQGNNMIMQMSNPADYDKGHGARTAESARDSVGLQNYLSGSSASSSGSSAASGASSSR